MVYTDSVIARQFGDAIMVWHVHRLSWHLDGMDLKGRNTRLHHEVDGNKAFWARLTGPHCQVCPLNDLGLFALLSSLLWPETCIGLDWLGVKLLFFMYLL